MAKIPSEMHTDLDGMKTEHATAAALAAWTLQLEKDGVVLILDQSSFHTAHNMLRARGMAWLHTQLDAARAWLLSHPVDNRHQYLGVGLFTASVDDWRVFEIGERVRPATTLRGHTTTAALARGPDMIDNG